MSITVHQLSKNYGSQKAVDRISFSVDSTEVVGFLGPNGAGKSTSMKMITGYLQADSGTIHVCGLPVHTNSIETKKKIGYLPESNPLYHDMYVRQYLHFIANIHQIRNAGEVIDTVIGTVGLRPESDKKIGQLSKGYKQRVGIAAALLHNPEVLILDEPTSGLDPNQIMEIRELIKTLGQTKTILFSSHIMQEIEAVCSRVIIINKGVIVADDKLQNLQKTSAKAELISVEFKEPVDMDVLNSLPGVISVSHTLYATFKIQCSNAEALKKELLKISIHHNLDIVSLQSEQQNLESVFKTLTT